MTTKALTIGDATITPEDGGFFLEMEGEPYGLFPTLAEAKAYVVECRNDALLEKLIEKAGRLGMKNPKTTARLLAALEALKG